MEEQNKPVIPVETSPENTKFCVHCGAIIPKDAVMCTKCGRMVEMAQQTAAAPQIVVNNTNTNANTNVNTNTNKNINGGNGRLRNKWVALALAIFLGFFGAHKFYEGKFGMGILYLFTAGLFGIGYIIDIIVILLKPTNYYV